MKLHMGKVHFRKYVENSQVSKIQCLTSKGSQSRGAKRPARKDYKQEDNDCER